MTENSPIGTHLVDVRATDADSGQNAYITYTITNGDPLKIFKVETMVSYIKINDHRLSVCLYAGSFFL